MNITLIGMSGAGKTYIGKRIARHLDLEFLDIDEAMEAHFGKPISDILEELGDDDFVRAESTVARDETWGRDKLLISTGGSIIYAPDAMQHLSDISTIVYLSVPFEVIRKRVGGSAERLSRIVGIGDKTLHELYDARVPFYEKYAHHSIEPEMLSMEEILAVASELALEHPQSD